MLHLGNRCEFMSNRSEKGASAVEYGLLLAAIAAVIGLLVFALGGYVKGAFQTTCTAFKDNSVSTTGSTC